MFEQPRLQLQLVQDPRQVELIDSTYRLTIADLEFGMFWSGEDGCAIRWPCEPSFFGLGPSAALELVDLLESRNLGPASVHATFRSEDGVLSRLSMPLGCELTHLPPGTSFARYEIELWFREGMPVGIVVTAENPHYKPMGGAQAGILLPRGFTWNSNILKWVVEHHRRRSKLLASLDVVGAADDLSLLCGGDRHLR